MLDYTHLKTLLAVENEGSFSEAGKVLGISAIGVSRRIEKLESRLGTKLLYRKPTRTSKAGRALCEHARDVIHLEDQFLAEQRSQGLQPRDAIPTMKIATDHHSFHGWFQAILEDQISNEDTHSYDVLISDHDHSLELMQGGFVIAAITSQKEPLHGFKSYKLGGVTYQPVCSPGFKQLYFSDGVTPKTISKAPALRYDCYDTLLLQWYDCMFDGSAKLVSSRLPSTKAIIDSCLSGDGWAMLPELDLSEALANGSLVKIIDDKSLIKELYWHVSSIMTETISPLTNSIRKTAKIIK